MDRTAYIRAQARARGLDPAAVIAVASREGLSGGIGDGGHAFGPWQLNNAGGVITGQFKGESPQQINQWAWSPSGINYALDRIAKVAKGLTGKQAVNSIVRNFERPAAPDAEVAGAISAYGGNATAVAPAGGPGKQAPAPGSAAAPVMGAGPVSGLDDKQTLLLSLLSNGGQDSTLTNLLAQHLSQQNAAAAPAPSLGSAPVASPAAPTALPGYSGTPGTYKDLQTEGGATLKGVNPKLLTAAERLAEFEHQPLTVASGYRDYAKQASLYNRYVQSGYNNAYIAAKPGSSNHESGNALDLLINGKPIDSLGAAVLARFGLHNGVAGDHPHTTLIGVNG
jgi:D-alanyl-D-alanine carboxypeptidase